MNFQQAISSSERKNTLFADPDTIKLQPLRLPLTFGNRFLFSTLFSFSVLFSASSYAVDPLTLPSGYESVTGNHQFSQGNGILNISTNANRSIVNYETFNVGQDAQVKFHLPSSSASILNRVTGGQLSEIYGGINSNGRVFLVNPSGILFGKGANISVSGLVASTLSLSNTQFLNGQYEFIQSQASPSAGIKIEKDAQINIANTGSASFITSSFVNQGNIAAPGGNIQVGVGDRITLGSDLVGLTINEPLKENLNHALLLNMGTLSAAQIKLIANTLKQDMRQIIVNNMGRIQANQVIDGEGGSIELIASQGIVNNSGQIDASGSQGGSINLQGQSSQNSGQLLATGSTNTGGQIQLLAQQQVSLSGNALLDVSGQRGGGSVLIGGDYRGSNPNVLNTRTNQIADHVLIKADALHAGNGGRVIVWADDSTQFKGTILARGGLFSGNGGFVETSGKNYLDMQGSVDAKALNASGHSGTWLLDPRNVRITNSLFNPAGDSLITASSINTALNNGTSVTINTNNAGSDAGNITLEEAILKLTPSNTALTLQAANDIHINNSITATQPDSFKLTLLSDYDVTNSVNPIRNGVGTININAPINLLGSTTRLDGTAINILSDIHAGTGLINLLASNGNITQANAGSSLSGDTLTAVAQAGNINLGVTGFSDFRGVVLNAPNGNIQYTDTDGVFANFNAGNHNVSMTVGKGGGFDNVGLDPNGLWFSGVTQGDTLTLLALQGDIIASDANIRVFGDHLNATTQANGAVINLGDADFNTANLKTNDGTITYKDRDGININAVATTSPNSPGHPVINIISDRGNDLNGNVQDSGITLRGINLATSYNLIANKGQILQTSNTPGGDTILGETLFADTKAANQGIFLTNTDLSRISLTTLNGPVVYQDSDGFDAKIQIGLGSATLSGGLSGLTFMNPWSGNDISFWGNNQAANLNVTNFKGNTSQSNGSSIAGNRLNVNNESHGRFIQLTDTDFNTASLKTSHGNILLQDRDGLAANFNAGDGTASITADLSSLTSNNQLADSGIQLIGQNLAKTSHLTTNQGAITEISNSAIQSENLNIVTNTGDVLLATPSNQVNHFSLTSNGNRTQFINTSNLNLAGISNQNGSVDLTARGGGHLTQSADIRTNELKVTLTDGGDAFLNTQNNQVISFSGNADSTLLNSAITENSQFYFSNEQNLNLAASNLQRGDLALTLNNGASLNQDNLMTSRILLTNGGITGSELTVHLTGNASASLNTQNNNLNVFAVSSQNASDSPNVTFSNISNLNLAQSNLSQGTLQVVANGSIDTLSDRMRDITANGNSTAATINLTALNNGNLNIANDITASQAISLTTANSNGTVQIHASAHVEAPTGTINLATNGLNLEGTIQGKSVQIAPWDLNSEMAVGSTSGLLQLTQNMLDRINTDNALGLNTIILGSPNYQGTVNLGSLDLRNHPLTNLVFNAPQVLESTPTLDTVNHFNLRMANNREVFFTAGANDVTQWSTAVGGTHYGDNAIPFADLDIDTSGSGNIHVKLADFVGSAQTFSQLTAANNQAFINVTSAIVNQNSRVNTPSTLSEDNRIFSFRKLNATLSPKAVSSIDNQVKGRTITLPGDLVPYVPTTYSGFRPSLLIPNQSF